jgi:hypothetical protein
MPLLQLGGMSSRLSELNGFDLIYYLNKAQMLGSGDGALAHIGVGQVNL